MHERIDIAAAVISFWTLKAHGAKRARITDFLPRWDRPEQTPEQLRQIMEGLASQPSLPSS